jgi:hypothetical protein
MAVHACADVFNQAGHQMRIVAKRKNRKHQRLAGGRGAVKAACQHPGFHCGGAGVRQGGAP